GIATADAFQLCLRVPGPHRDRNPILMWAGNTSGFTPLGQRAIRNEMLAFREASRLRRKRTHLTPRSAVQGATETERNVRTAMRQYIRQEAASDEGLWAPVMAR